MVSIESLLHRRTDLSTFLVHFTRLHDGSTARDNLLSILTTRTLEARSLLGMAVQLARRVPAVAETQKTISFSETPLEHAWTLCQEIDYRQVKLEPYGLAFTKSWARRKGCNPVWYLDITPGHTWLTNAVNDLVHLAEHEPRAWDKNTNLAFEASLESVSILCLTPFIEQMGPMAGGGRKEFWWEREWRHQGDVTFSSDDPVAVFVPAEDHDTFREEYRSRLGEDRGGWAGGLKLLDPSWGLERMIAALADVPSSDAGPLP